MGLIAISSLVLLGGMYLMIAFAWWLLQIIANWRIFTKAGEAGCDNYYILSNLTKLVKN